MSDPRSIKRYDSGRLSYGVIGVCIDVQRQLGLHCMEVDYQRALELALSKRGLRFQHDPLACAIALGWNEGVEISEIPWKLETKSGWLCDRVDDSGRPTGVVTKVNGGKFNEFWLNTVVGNRAVTPAVCA